MSAITITATTSRASPSTISSFAFPSLTNSPTALAAIHVSSSTSSSTPLTPPRTKYLSTTDDPSYATPKRLQRVQRFLYSPDTPTPDFSAFNTLTSSSSTIQVPLSPKKAPLHCSGARAFTAAASTIQVPPTPRKVSLHRPDATVFTAAALRVGLMVVYQGKKAPLVKIGEGHFKVAYEIPTSYTEPLVTGHANQDILIKTFKQDLLIHSPKKVESYLATSLAHYSDLLSRKFPVTRILNFDTIRTDGYLIVERAAPFVPSWDPLTPLHELSPSQKIQIRELYQLFRLSFGRRSSIACDLQSNIGIDKKGNLVLFDFTEQEEEPFGTMDITSRYAFHTVARKNIEAFANGHLEAYQYLLSSALFSGSPIGTKSYEEFNRDPSGRVIVFDDNLKSRVLSPCMPKASTILNIELPAPTLRSSPAKESA